MQVELRTQKAAKLSFWYNVAQTALKLVGAVLTGSVSLLSEALHSASDVISAFVSLMSVRAASAPPDDEHPYGHGKIDTLAGMSEAILLFVFSLYTGAISVLRFFEEPQVEQVGFGIIIVSICAIGSVFVYLIVQKVASETGSFALRSNAQHIQVDFVTTIGVLVALAVTKLTGWHYADPLFGAIFALWLCLSSVKMIHKAFHEVIDSHIDPDEIEKIMAILNEEEDLISFHKLRTRHSGQMHYIEIHLVVPRNWTVVQGHELADRVEKSIEKQLAPAICTIHIDPEDVLDIKKSDSR